jgi:hypothetical protein
MSNTEPDRIIVTRWRCPHCRRSWAGKAPAAAHIARCWLNPDNRSCKTCVNHEPATASSYEEPGSDEHCFAGIKLEAHEYREGIIVLPLHCPQWKQAKGWAA